MLERVAVHQSRLRAPGLRLDARGVAIGTHGLLLFPSLDRLVAFLALLTQGRAIDELAAAVRVEVVKSKLGAREIVAVFPVEAIESLDAVGGVALLAGGRVFTGGGRYWVQARDAGAPYGYDLGQVTPGEGAYLLHHMAFTQAFDVERAIDLRRLMLRLAPRVDPAAGREPGRRWVLAEWGLGGALIGYLHRSGVTARVGLCEWPPASALEDGPVRRYVFEIEQVPPRMVPLLTRTPGLTTFEPIAQGAAVEVGFRHPVHLAAMPAFRGPGVVFFRGRGEEPIEVARLPSMGELGAFARVEVVRDRRGAGGEGDGLSGVSAGAAPREPARSIEVPSLRVPVRLVPSMRPALDVSATWVDVASLPQLRRLIYALGGATLRRFSIAVTGEGALLRGDPGAWMIPLGAYHRQVAPGVYLPLGYEPSPAVGAATLAAALDVPSGSVVLMRPDGPARVIAASAFVPLEAALIEGPAWAPMRAVDLSKGAGDGVSDRGGWADDGTAGELGDGGWAAALGGALPSIELVVEDPGGDPLRDVERPEGEA